MLKTSMRTHTCNELTKKDTSKKVTLCGFCHTIRNHGGVVFIDLRDRYGLTQIVFDPQHSKETHKEADKLRREFVISITGVVRQRKNGMENSNKKIYVTTKEKTHDHYNIYNILMGSGKTTVITMLLIIRFYVYFNVIIFINHVSRVVY